MVAEHGSYTRYTQGCHCGPCREANREYKVPYNRRWRRTGPVRICEECGGEYRSRKRTQRFCGGPCQVAWFVRWRRERNEERQSGTTSSEITTVCEGETT